MSSEQPVIPLALVDGLRLRGNITYSMSRSVQLYMKRESESPAETG